MLYALWGFKLIFNRLLSDQSQLLVAVSASLCPRGFENGDRKGLVA